MSDDREVSTFLRVWEQLSTQHDSSRTNKWNKIFNPDNASNRILDARFELGVQSDLYRRASTFPLSTVNNAPKIQAYRFTATAGRKGILLALNATLENDLKRIQRDLRDVARSILHLASISKVQLFLQTQFKSSGKNKEAVAFATILVTTPGTPIDLKEQVHLQAVKVLVDLFKQIFAYEPIINDFMERLSIQGLQLGHLYGSNHAVGARVPPLIPPIQSPNETTRAIGLVNASMVLGLCALPVPLPLTTTSLPPFKTYTSIDEEVLSMAYEEPDGEKVELAFSKIVGDLPFTDSKWCQWTPLVDRNEPAGNLSSKTSVANSLDKPDDRRGFEMAQAVILDVIASSNDTPAGLCALLMNTSHTINASFLGPQTTKLVDDWYTQPISIGKRVTLGSTLPFTPPGMQIRIHQKPGLIEAAAAAAEAAAEASAAAEAAAKAAAAEAAAAAETFASLQTNEATRLATAKTDIETLNQVLKQATQKKDIAEKALTSAQTDEEKALREANATGGRGVNNPAVIAAGKVTEQAESALVQVSAAEAKSLTARDNAVADNVALTAQAQSNIQAAEANVKQAEAKAMQAFQSLVAASDVMKAKVVGATPLTTQPSFVLGEGRSSATSLGRSVATTSASPANSYNRAAELCTTYSVDENLTSKSPSPRTNPDVSSTVSSPASTKDLLPRTYAKDVINAAIHLLHKLEHNECEQRAVKTRLNEDEESPNAQDEVELTKRRKIVWDDATRNAAISGDRLYSFYRQLSGTAGESMNAVVQIDDSQYQRDLVRSREQATKLSTAASERFAGLIESTFAGLFRQSGLTFAIGNAQEVSIVSGNLRKQLTDLAQSEVGGLFQKSVELETLIESAKGKLTLTQLVRQLTAIGDVLQRSTYMAAYNPTSTLSIETVALPSNSLLLNVRDVATAAVNIAYDNLTRELNYHYHRMRVPILYELVEGPDVGLSNAFATLCAHVMVQQRLHAGAAAAYVTKWSASINARMLGVALKRAVDAVCVYVGKYHDPTTVATREEFFTPRYST